MHYSFQEEEALIYKAYFIISSKQVFFTIFMVTRKGIRLTT